MNEVLFNIWSYSSEEEDNPVNEILKSKKSSKGWQSKRYCEYPQIIILELEKKSTLKDMEILSHQSKISSKVEISICNLEYENRPSNINDINFEKFGYFHFDSNQTKNYKMRELKTVTLDTECNLLKLTFYKCHMNDKNIFNQVSIIKIILSGGQETHHLENQNNLNINNKLEHEYNNSKIDHQLENQIKDLERQKLMAIKNEEFLVADNLKNKIKQIVELSQKIRILESRLKNALVREEYRDAHEIKLEIKKIKSFLNNNNSNENNYEVNNNKKFQNNQNNNNLHNNHQNNQINHNINSNQNNNKNYHNNIMDDNINNNEQEDEYEYNNVNNNNEYNNGNEYNNDNNDNNDNEYNNDNNYNSNIDHNNYNSNINHNNKQDFNNNNNNNNQEIKMNSSNFYINNPEERPINAGNSRMYENVIDNENYTNTNSNEEKINLNDKQLKIAGIIYPLYPNDNNLVNLLFSKKWQNREIFLKKILNDIKNNYFNDNKSQVFVIIIYICSIGLFDTVFQITKLTIEIICYLLEFFNIKKINTNDFNSYLEKVLNSLMEKISNNKYKDYIIKSINLMAEKEVIGYDEVISHLVKIKTSNKILNFPKNIAARLLLIKDLVNINEFDINKNVKIVNLATEYLEHKNNEVRNNAYNLILEISQQIGYSQIYSLLKENKVKKSILESLEKNYNQWIDLPNNNLNEEEEVYNNNNIEEKYDDNTDNNPDENSKKCLFCDIVNNNFKNENIKDMHFVKECPMLSECNYCKNVIEINDIQDHLYNECSYKDEFNQCSRCQLLIHNNDYDEHISTLTCEKINSSEFRACPLCKQIIDNNKYSLKRHILTDGCPNNPRTK